MNKSRLCDLGYVFGDLPTGATNSLSDVPGVWVGHTSVNPEENKPSTGTGLACTGVTIVLPHSGNLFREKVVGAVHTINGYGKAVGFEQVRELGLIEAPIALTNTLNVGLVLDALVEHSINQSPEIGADPHFGSINVLVGETNDGYLNDIRGRHVKAEHVWSAIQNAVGGKVVQGSIGAGSGTVCFGWKGGIGSASRIIHTKMGNFLLGALIQSNYGASRDLTVLGVPVGRFMTPPQIRDDSSGSVMVVVGTDAPFDCHQLERLCVRVAAGLARTGALFSQGSGDFVIAFSTARQMVIERAGPKFLVQQMNDPELIDPFFRAVVETVEESVINSLTCAKTTTGRDGHLIHALPIERVVAQLNRAGIRPGNSATLPVE